MTGGTWLYYDERMLEHDMGAGHCERPERLRAIVERLRRADPPHATWKSPTPATREQILRVHTARHVDYLESLRGAYRMIDGDTSVCPASIDAAYLAAGATINAIEAVVSRAADNAFALVRPPGHHATPDRAMGFCLMNNIAIGAAHAIEALGCARVLVVDWDVHHGNGTQDAFAARDDVTFISMHRGNFYPGSGGADETGRDRGWGHTVNLPLPPGLGDPEYIALMREVVAPVAREFGPDLVLVSAGFDAHARDPLGGMRVTENGFAHLCAVVKSVADACADGCLVLVLEGGYDLEALAESVLACVEVMGGDEPPMTADGDPTVAAALVGHFRERFARHFEFLRGQSP